MVLLFTGTSTGNMYQEGERYRGSGGDTFVANRDGSFTNERSGRTSVGSSQSPDVSWYSSGETREANPVLYTDAGRAVYERPGGGGSGPASSEVTNQVTNAPSDVPAAHTASGGAGPGSAAVVAATVGNRGVFMTQLGTQLPYDKPSPVMPIVIGGRLVAHDAGWSNAADGEDRWGENELLSPSWFHAWGVAGADAWANADVTNGGPIKTRKVQEDIYNAPGVLGNGLTTLGQGFLDTREAMRSPFGPDKPLPGFTSGGF